MTILVPIRTGRGLNDRGHWRVKARAVKAERQATAWVLKNATRPAIPCSVLLTRIAPSNGLDDDGVVGSLKSVRDEVARWLGVDDRRRDIVRYAYGQRRGEWGVEIHFGPPPAGAQLTLDDGVRPDTTAGDHGLREACGA